jgi:hypothetical protein
MDDPALLAILQTWFWSRPIDASLDFTPQPIQSIPAQLEATITHYEPYRSQALQDALLWLQLPLAVSIGLETIPIEPFEIRAIEHWQEAVSPLDLRLEWSVSMAGDEIDWTTDSIHCVAREAGQWRIVALFGDTQRVKVQEIITHGTWL